MDYKEMSIKKGYVPKTCTKDGTMIWAATLSDVDPCMNCPEDRSVCGGRMVNHVTTFGCCGG